MCIKLRIHSTLVQIVAIKSSHVYAPNILITIFQTDFVSLNMAKM